jgi:hypothetical protein
MRIPLRSLASLLLAVGVATCSDAPSTGVTPANGPSGVGVVNFQPTFSPAAAAAFARLADFAIDFDHVHVSIIRPPSETVKDTLIAFRPGQSAITLDLTVPVRVPGEVFKVTIDYVTTQSVVFHGEGTVASHAPDQPAPPQQITIEYKGPGFNAARIVVAPKTAKLVAPATQTFTVSAFDASNAAVANVPINWTTSDASVATISSAGVLTPTGKRGTVTVTALTPNNLTDNASVAITLPPTSIVLVSGGGQTGKAGAALAQPAVVKVLASDGGGVADVTVNFAAPVGGKVGSASATTDANGQATSSLTLGGAVGPQAFAAAAAGFSVAIPETATPGDAASISATSGGGQADTVRHALKNPLVVRVVDQFGNGIGGVTVTWTRAGTGTLSATSSTTAADGSASVNYTLGTVVGTETITASAAGVATAATFTVQALPAAPSTIVAVSGSGQSGRVGQVLAAAFVVHVADDAANPVSGATVSWTAVNGTLPATTTTDAQGNSSNTLTLGSTVGNASATATVNGKSVTFTATVQVGIVAKAVFRTQPPNGTVNQALAPAVQVELQDAGGNRTAASNSVTIALGANPGQATLAGTLTRNAVGGVATFDDLTLSAVGTGYTLVASSAGVPSIASTPFNIGAATGALTLTIVAGDQQTGVVNAALPISPMVRVEDANERAQVGVAVTFTPAAGSGSVVPATSVLTDTAGIARLVSWTFGQTAGPQSMVASAPNAASVTFHGTATAGAPFKLVMVTQPPATATSGIQLTTQPSVQIEDQFNNPTASGQVQVTAAFASGTATNNVATTNAGGLATFTDLTLTASGTGSSSGPIVFSAPNLQSASSNPVTVSAPSQNTLLIIDPTTGNTITGNPLPPITIAAGALLPANTPVIKIVNSAGQPVAGAQVFIQVTGPTFLNSTLNSDANGLVQFLNPTAPATAGTYTATASGNGLLGTPRSVTITVTPGPADHHQWTFQMIANSTVTVGQPFPTVAVGLFDHFNNPVPTNGVTIGITLDQTQATNQTAQLGGTTTALTVNGVATFNALSVSITGSAGTGYRLIATNLTNTANPAPIFGNPFGIAPAAPATSIVALTPAITTTVGSGIATYPSFKVLNNSAQGVPGVQVSFFSSTAACTIPDPTVLTTDANGVVTLSAANLTVNTGTAASCAVDAATVNPELPLAIASVIVAPAGTVSWTGVTSSSWNTATNWSSGVVPSATDQVFLPGAVLHQATLAGPTSIGALITEPNVSAEVDVGNFVFTINGSVSGNHSVVHTTGSGSVQLNASAAATISGFFGTPVSVGAPGCSTTYTLAGLFTNAGLTVNCPLNLDTLGILVSGNGVATIQNNGLLIMTKPQAFLSTTGDMNFQGASEAGFMTDGGLSVGGNLNVTGVTSSSPFAATAKSVLSFAGLGAHSLNVSNAGNSTFASVTISPSSSITVTSTNALTFGGALAQSGTLTVPTGVTLSVSGITVFASGAHTTVNGTMNLGANSIFTSQSFTSGTGTMTAQTPCQKGANASVSVGDPANPFTAAACSTGP